MKLWIARDKQGWLQLYLGKPCFRLKYLVEDWDGTFMGYLPKENFPEVTFENSPQEVELVIKKQYENRH